MSVAEDVDPKQRTLVVFACEPDWALRGEHHRMVYETSWEVRALPEWELHLKLHAQYDHYHALVLQTGELIAWLPDRAPRILKSCGHASVPYLQAVASRSDAPEPVRRFCRTQAGAQQAVADVHAALAELGV